jgi:hypothetical protein
MRRLPLTLLALLLTITAAGCGTKVKIATGALDEMRNVTRLNVPKTIELSDSNISTLANQADVSESVIREVAPELDTQSAWKSSLTKLREFVDRVPEEIRAGTIEVACDAVKEYADGQPVPLEELAETLVDKFNPVDDAEIVQIANSFIDYYVDMQGAMDAGNEKAAAVILTCYVAEQSA